MGLGSDGQANEHWMFMMSVYDPAYPLQLEVASLFLQWGQFHMTGKSSDLSYNAN